MLSRVPCKYKMYPALTHAVVMQLFSIEGRNEQDYLHQMERDACISYVADAVRLSFSILIFLHTCQRLSL